jgi:hypothetical protein
VTRLGHFGITSRTNESLISSHFEKSILWTYNAFNGVKHRLNRYSRRRNGGLLGKGMSSKSTCRYRNSFAEGYAARLTIANRNKSSAFERFDAIKKIISVGSRETGLLLVATRRWPFVKMDSRSSVDNEIVIKGQGRKTMQRMRKRHVRIQRTKNSSIAYILTLVKCFEEADDFSTASFKLYRQNRWTRCQHSETKTSCYSRLGGPIEGARGFDVQIK